MTILLNWYGDDQRIILAELQGVLGWDTMQQSRNQLRSLANSSTSVLSLICILSSDISLPPTGFAEDSKIAFHEHASINLYQVIYVTKDAHIRALWQSVVDIYANASVNYHFVPTFEAALRLVS